MIAYKGFNKKLCSVMGDGKKETCQFKLGETKKVDSSKTARSGFHCCENPFECLSYYALNGENRFFKVEAAGDIDEDATERIACTQITLLEELTPLQFALEGMKYIISHPDRQKWQQHHGSVSVKKDKATAKEKGCIAIARGKDPKVAGPEGSILGMIVENKTGIIQCKLFVVNTEQAGKLFRLTDDRELEVVDEEKES